MHLSDVRVIHRNLRWEVSIRHVTRPIVDWFFSRERAVEEAKEEALRLGASGVRVEHWDGTLDEWIELSIDHRKRLSFVA